MATFNLQTGPDNLSGGNSDDTFFATYNDGMTGTFTIGDALNGNAGIDTLDITPIGVAAITPPDTLWTNISNIENIIINPTGAGAQTITTGAAFQSAFAAAGVNLKTTSGAGAITTDMSSFTGALTLTTISDAGAQTIITGAGPSTVTATSTAGAQTITTGAGPSTVTATSTAGVQTITTGAGADVITATTTAVNNIINAGAGNDTVMILASATGNYTINGNDGDDNISGGAANDTLNGDIGDDILIGFNPNNSSLGRGEIDTLLGGAGSDRFVLGVGYDDGSNTSSGAADFADIKDFNIVEGDVIQLTGSSTDYLLTVVGADTQILINKPGGEPDELIGLIRGQTTLSLTGASFVYSPPPVFAIASAAATEGGAITFTVTRTGDAQANQSVTVATSIGGTDTASANDFTANNQILTFAQGETTKNFTVQTTQDAVFEGNETFTTTLSGATGGATISPTNGTATGTINDADDCVFGTALAFSKLRGKKGITKRGDGSGNILGGGNGNDILRGLNGNDHLAGRGGNDRLNGDRGKDVIAGGAGRDFLRGGGDNDKLKGDSGNDILLGENGKDLLVGGNGSDILIGGAKKDILQGGKGKDMFVFRGLASEGNDLIKDFETQLDVIDLRPVFARSGFTGISPDAKFHQYIQTVQVGSSTEVRVDLDGAGSRTVFGAIATLKNINASTISCSNFVVA